MKKMKNILVLSTLATASSVIAAVTISASSNVQGNFNKFLSAKELETNQKDKQALIAYLKKIVRSTGDQTISDSDIESYVTKLLSLNYYNSNELGTAQDNYFLTNETNDQRFDRYKKLLFRGSWNNDSAFSKAVSLDDNNYLHSDGGNITNHQKIRIYLNWGEQHEHDPFQGRDQINQTVILDAISDGKGGVIASTFTGRIIHYDISKDANSAPAITDITEKFYAANGIAREDTESGNLYTLFGKLSRDKDGNIFAFVGNDSKYYRPGMYNILGTVTGNLYSGQTKETARAYPTKYVVKVDKNFNNAQKIDLRTSTVLNENFGKATNHINYITSMLPSEDGELYIAGRQGGIFKTNFANSSVSTVFDPSNNLTSTYKQNAQMTANAPIDNLYWVAEDKFVAMSMNYDRNDYNNDPDPSANFIGTNKARLATLITVDKQGKATNVSALSQQIFVNELNEKTVTSVIPYFNPNNGAKGIVALDKKGTLYIGANETMDLPNASYKFDSLSHYENVLNPVREGWVGWTNYGTRRAYGLGRLVNLNNGLVMAYGHEGSYRIFNPSDMNNQGLGTSPIDNPIIGDNINVGNTSFNVGWNSSVAGDSAFITNTPDSPPFGWEATAYISNAVPDGNNGVYVFSIGGHVQHFSIQKKEIPGNPGKFQYQLTNAIAEHANNYNATDALLREWNAERYIISNKNAPLDAYVDAANNGLALNSKLELIDNKYYVIKDGTNKNNNLGVENGYQLVYAKSEEPDVWYTEVPYTKEQLAGQTIKVKVVSKDERFIQPYNSTPQDFVLPKNVDVSKDLSLLSFDKKVIIQDGKQVFEYTLKESEKAKIPQGIKIAAFNTPAFVSIYDNETGKLTIPKEQDSKDITLRYTIDQVLDAKKYIISGELTLPLAQRQAFYEDKTNEENAKKAIEQANNDINADLTAQTKISSVQTALSAVSKYKNATITDQEAKAAHDAAKTQFDASSEKLIADVKRSLENDLDTSYNQLVENSNETDLSRYENLVLAYESKIPDYESFFNAFAESSHAQDVSKLNAHKQKLEDVKEFVKVLKESLPAKDVSLSVPVRQASLDTVTQMTKNLSDPWKTAMELRIADIQQQIDLKFFTEEYKKATADVSNKNRLPGSVDKGEVTVSGYDPKLTATVLSVNVNQDNDKQLDAKVEFKYKSWSTTQTLPINGFLNQAEIDAQAVADKLAAATVAVKAAEDADKENKQSAYDSAKTLVEALDESEQKTALLGRLEAVKAAIDSNNANDAATAAVVVAEQATGNSTQLAAELKKAQDLVTPLKDETKKAELQARIDAVQTKIDKLAALEAATEAVANAENAEPSAKQATYDTAKTLVEDLDDSEQRTALLGRLEAVKATIDLNNANDAATAAVVAAEQATGNSTELAAELKKAQDLVTTLKDVAKKAELQARIDAIQTKIDKLATLEEATEAVTNAENAEPSAKQAAYDAAKTLVEDLDDSEQRTALLGRLEAVKAAIDSNNANDAATAAVVAAEQATGNSTELAAELKKAQDLVTPLKDETKKAELQARIDAIQTKIDKLVALEEATEAVANAENAEPSAKQAAYDAAKTLVEDLDDSEQRTALVQRLEAVKAAIDSNNANDAATVAVVAAEQVTGNSTELAAELKKAQDLVTPLKDETKKAELQARINAVQTKIDKLASLEVATEAVEAAENAEPSAKQAAYDAAKTLVEDLDDSEQRTALVQRLEAVKAAIDLNTAVNAAEVAMKAAEDKNGTIAEREVRLLAAKTAISDIKNQNEQDKFTSRVEAVQQQIAQAKLDELANGLQISVKASSITKLPSEIELSDLDITDKDGNPLDPSVSVALTKTPDNTAGTLTSQIRLTSGTLTSKPKTQQLSGLATDDSVEQAELNVAVSKIQISLKDETSKQKQASEITNNDISIKDENGAELSSDITTNVVLSHDDETGTLTVNVTLTKDGKTSSPKAENISGFVTNEQKALKNAENATQNAETSVDSDASVQEKQAAIKTAKDLVDVLPEGVEKDTLLSIVRAAQNKLNDQIDKATKLKEATDAVTAAETSVDSEASATDKQAAIKTAKDLVDALPEGTEKETLLAKVQAVQDKLNDQIDKATKLKEATDAVTSAETFVDSDVSAQEKQAAIKAAKDLVDAFPEGTEKEALLAKVQAAQNKLNDQIEKATQLKEATNAVTAAETSLDSETTFEEKQEAINTAKDLVDALPKGAQKEALLAKVQAAQDKLNAQKLVDNAKNIVNSSIVTQKDKQVLITEAQKLVDALPNSEDKDEFNKTLKETQAKLDKQNELEAAKKAVKLAEEKFKSDQSNEIKQNAIDDARKLVNKLEKSDDKNILETRLNNLRDSLPSTDVKNNNKANSIVLWSIIVTGSLLGITIIAIWLTLLFWKK